MVQPCPKYQCIFFPQVRAEELGDLWQDEQNMAALLLYKQGASRHYSMVSCQTNGLRQKWEYCPKTDILVRVLPFDAIVLGATMGFSVGRPPLDNGQRDRVQTVARGRGYWATSAPHVDGLSQLPMLQDGTIGEDLVVKPAPSSINQFAAGFGAMPDWDNWGNNGLSNSSRRVDEYEEEEEEELPVDYAFLDEDEQSDYNDISSDLRSMRRRRAVSAEPCLDTGAHIVYRRRRPEQETHHGDYSK